MQTQLVVLCFIAFLRQPCNKVQGKRVAVLRHLRVKYLSASSYVSRKSLVIKLHKNHKENEQVKNLVKFVVVAAL